MSSPRARTFGSVALGLSLLTFCIYFLNVLVGGPLGHKPWMNEVAEMLTLFLAVVFFVAGTIAREAQARPETDGPADQKPSGETA